MAITQVETVEIDGITIGLSDEIGTLITNGDFTVENLVPYMICGQMNKLCPIYASITGAESTYSGSGSNLPLWFPNINTGSLGDPTIETAQNDNPALPHDMYGRNILIYGSLDTYQNCIKSTNTSSTLRVVTSIDFKKIYYDVEMSSATLSDATRPSPKTFTYYQSGMSGAIKTADNNIDTTINIFSVVQDEVAGNWYCIIDDLFPKSDTTNVPWIRCSGQFLSGPYNSIYATLNDGWSSYSNTKKLWRWAKPLGYEVYGGEGWNWGIGFDGYIDNGGNCYSYISYTGASQYASSCFCVPDGLEYALNQVANVGLKFKWNNTWYKPLGEGGYITGYTDDMTEESDWDDIVDVTGNNIPDAPPSPVPPTPPEGDEFDDHAMGAGTGISGMANLWLLTASQLSDLHAACNSAPIGFDPLNSFISVMGIGTNPEYLTHEIQYITPINIRMSDGTTWQTHVEGHIVSKQVSAFSFTGISVQRKYNNFLDYTPYATHEIFVPMCGWLTLPDIAVDREITVTYIPDIESLKCRAVVSVVDNSGRKCVIGEKDGIMGADVPFTNSGHSLYVGESIVNGSDIAGEAITMAIGANFTKKNAKGGTFRPYEGFTVGGAGILPGAIGNAFVSGGINRTRYISGNGTRVGFSDGENIQVKSTYHKVDIPENYAHTVGLMCNKTGKLETFTGFTVCDNPHINFSALEAEKEEIKRLLEEGVIL